jgi:hypothetical protein
MFHFMSKSVRSTTVSSFNPTRVAPKWSTVGPTIVPSSVAGRVIPFIVISPSIVARSPSRASSPLKVRTGWRSASKNSGESTCVWRFSSFSLMLSIFAEPSRCPSTSVAVKSVTSPENVATA